MKKLLLFLFLVALHGRLLGQEELHVFEHHVKPGETVRLISKKYLVSPSDIYQLNKFAVDGITPGMILHIPMSSKAAAEKMKKPAADKQPKPTVATDADLEQVMDEVAEEALQKDADAAAQDQFDDVVEHVVAPEETLLIISRKYNVSVEDLKKSNEKLLAHGLQAGQVIKIKRNK